VEEISATLAARISCASDKYIEEWERERGRPFALTWGLDPGTLIDDVRRIFSRDCPTQNAGTS
jgi:hypothetical protein